MISNTKNNPVKSLRMQAKDNEIQGDSKIYNDKKGQRINGKKRKFSNDNQVKFKMIREAEIDLSKKVQKPPVILSLNDMDLFYTGDFSLTIGKAKSRKTFLTTMFIAVLVGNSKTDKLNANLPKDKRTVLLFDTEQGKYHATKSANRVLRLLGISHPENFRAFSLRRYSTTERLQIIEYLIYNTPNLGVVFIDGIRDLVTSINDEEQATKISSKLLKWSDEKQIHINCVLHMNKADNNARGHLGTELLNKSLVTISVSKIPKVPEYSSVVVTQSREKEPPPFIIGINKEDLPFVVAESDLPTTISKILKSQAFDVAEHSDILRSEVFSKGNELTYNEIIAAVKKEYGIGINKAKDYVRHFVEENLIVAKKHGNKTNYCLV